MFPPFLVYTTQLDPSCPGELGASLHQDEGQEVKECQNWNSILWILHSILLPSHQWPLFHNESGWYPESNLVAFQNGNSSCLNSYTCTRKVPSQSILLIGQEIFCPWNSKSIAKPCIPSVKRHTHFQVAVILEAVFYYSQRTCLLYTSPSPRDKF